MSTNTKIVHMTSVHPQFDSRIFHKECKTLARVGYEVVLITPGLESGNCNGVRIHAVPKPTNRWYRMTLTAWKIYRAAIVENASVYHFHDPELIPVCLLLKLHRKHVIYDSHEDLPRQILSKAWIPRKLRGLVSNIAEILESMSARCFDGIVAATPTIANRFPIAKTTTIHNFPNLQEFESTNLVRYNGRGALIAYAGGISLDRGIREMIRAVHLLRDHVEAKLVIAGTFDPPELEDEIRKLCVGGSVVFLGQQDRKGVACLLHAARIGIVVYHPIRNYLEGYPTKLFEYMASGIPAVASSFPVWREVIAGVGCCLFVDPLCPKAIADAFEWLLTHPEEAKTMGKRGQEAAASRFNWDTEGTKLINLYRRYVR